MKLSDVWNNAEHPLVEAYVFTDYTPGTEPELMRDDWWTDNDFTTTINPLMRIRGASREVLTYIEENDLEMDAYDMIPVITMQTLLANRYKYQHLWKLNNAEYEPLYNLDVTNKTTFDWSMNRNGEDKNVRSGEDKNVASGSDTTSNSTTTYDSTADHATDKSSISHGRTDTRTYTNLEDKRTYTNLKDAKSGTETIQRYGNQGVTMATQMAEAEMIWSDKLKFIEIVVDDLLNAISYLW